MTLPMSVKMIEPMRVSAAPLFRSSSFQPLAFTRYDWNVAHARAKVVATKPPMATQSISPGGSCGISPPAMSPMFGFAMTRFTTNAASMSIRNTCIMRSRIL